MTANLSTFKTTASQDIFAKAKQLMPGGVSSPVRAFKSVGGEPIVFDRVSGAYACDIDGNKYIDYVGFSLEPGVVCRHNACQVIKVPYRFTYNHALTCRKYSARIIGNQIISDCNALSPIDLVQGTYQV